ncbi:MAG: phage major capsid protein [Gammaproteobacteria bacterium]|nr:phage major capsid protein [Gammaproteobacteria bacterium]
MNIKRGLVSALLLVGLTVLGAAHAGIAPEFLTVGFSSIDPMMGLALVGVGNIELIGKQITNIENSMEAFQKKAADEIANVGKISAETIASIDSLGEKQHEIAERLLAIEQSASSGGDPESTIVSMGKQFTDSDVYASFKDGQQQKARFEIENSTTTGSDATVAPDRKTGIVPGASEILTLEGLLVSLPTSSNAIEYTREATFTNNAVEVVEGGAKAQTNITFDLQTSPVRTIAHWTKISRQLADDAPALAAYINFRMTYGVNQRVETQIATGDGTGANLSGMLQADNYTAHGIANSALGSVLKKHVLIRKVIAQLKSTGYMADAVLLNPIDFAEMEIEDATTANVKGINFGIPVVESNGIPQDQFVVGAFMQAATKHDRQAVVIELSDSDGDNFTKNLITIRAERRLAFTVEVPAAVMGGDLTPV